MSSTGGSRGSGRGGGKGGSRGRGRDDNNKKREKSESPAIERKKKSNINLEQYRQRDRENKEKGKQHVEGGSSEQSRPNIVGGSSEQSEQTVASERGKQIGDDGGREDRQSGYASAVPTDQSIERYRNRDLADRGGYRGGRSSGGGGGSAGGGVVGERRGAATLYAPGSIPNEIPIWTNFYEIRSLPNWILYQYHVEFDPPMDNKRMRRALLERHDKILFPQNCAFNGVDILYSTTKLEKDVTEVVSRKEREGVDVKIRIKRVAEIQSTSNEFRTLLNVILKKCLRIMNYIEFGRDGTYFNFNSMEALHHNIQLAKGYKTSIELYGNKLLLYSEVADKILSMSSVRDTMDKIREKSNRENTPFREDLSKVLVGSKVITYYNNRIYTVSGIDFEQNPESTFLMKDKPIKYADYMRNHYCRETKDLKQPLLMINPSKKEAANGKRPIYLIPEHCYLTGRILARDFSFTEKRDVDTVSRMIPEQRCKALNELVDNIKENRNTTEELNRWNVELGDVVQLNAKYLTPSPVQYSGQHKEVDTQNGWNDLAQRAPHLIPVRIQNWVVFFLTKDKDRAESALLELDEVAVRMSGLKLTDPVRISIAHSGVGIAHIFKTAISNYLNPNPNNRPQLIMCLTPNKNKSNYEEIKTLCCCDYAIPSQVVCLNTINKSPKSVMSKAFTQISSKLGAIPWGVEIPEVNTMVVGMDVLIDTETRTQSVCSFVSSLNGRNESQNLPCTQWYSKCTFQNGGIIYFNNLTMLMMGALVKYRERNNVLPTRIFIYRDGVSEGQLDVLREHELPQIQEAFKIIDENYTPIMSFIIVIKRGNARLARRFRESLFNPPAGTVVDTRIVRNPGFDFYMISQIISHVTVQPTYYKVIKDTEYDNDLSNNRTGNDRRYSLDYIQRMTYKLTHLYFNWDGQIRVPAPCQYATKLSHLVANFLHRAPSDGMEHLLYYL